MDESVVARFVRERLALTRLTHPHVVRARDLIVDGDVLALVMDLVDGPTLRRLLEQRGRLRPEQATRLGAQIAQALAAAHAAGVVHRDLKPGNILLAAAAQDGDADAELSARVADLGIAALAGDRTVTLSGEIIGTASYMAPEMIQGAPATAAMDVYALGIILYQMCVGRPPFTGGAVEAVLHQQLNAQPKRPPEIPEQLWAIVTACLNKSPQARPGAAQVAVRLSALDDGRVLAVAAPGGHVPHPQRGETRRLLSPAPVPDEMLTPLVRAGSRWAKPVALGAIAIAVVAVAFAATQTLRDKPAAQPTGTATTVAPSVAVVNWDLDQYPYDVIANGLGPVERNMAVGAEAPGDGGPISLGGTAYQRGLGVHAHSHIRIAVNGACQRLRAKVGIDDQSAKDQTGTVVVTITADGETLFEEAVSWETGPRDIDLAVDGRQVLELIVSDGGDGADGDAASWGDARFEGCSS
jgi:hypothetical protein